MGQTLPVLLIVLGRVKVELQNSEILKAWEWFYIHVYIHLALETGVVRALAGVALCIVAGRAMPLYEKPGGGGGGGIKIVLLICPFR